MGNIISGNNILVIVERKTNFLKITYRSSLSLKSYINVTKKNREVIENLSHSGLPCIAVNYVKIYKVKEIALKNRPVDFKEIAEDLNISYGWSQDILV